MKIKNFFKKKNYLMQLFFTIAGLCCVPLIILQLVMLGQSTQGYSKMNEEIIYENLSESVQWFHQQVDDMSKTAIKISQDSTIRNAARADCTPYKRYEAHNRIDSYSNDQYEVGVWFQATDTTLFRQVNITSERLYQILAGSDADALNAVETFFEKEDYTRITSTARFPGSQTNLIVVAKPVSFISLVNKDALVFFTMDQTAVEKELRARFHDSSAIAILDDRGQFLVRGQDFTQQLWENDAFVQFLSDEQASTYVTSNGEANICIYKYRDASSGYISLVSIFEDGMQAYLRQWVNGIRTMLFFSTLVIIALLVLTVYINYRPLRMLVSKYGDKAPTTELSELEILDSAFLAADEKLSDQKQQLKHFLLGDLLRGLPLEEQMLLESGLTTNTYGYIVFSLHGPTVHSDGAQQIAQIMQQACDCECYITAITYQPQQLMICVLHDKMEDSDIQAQADSALQQVMGQPYGIHPGTLVEKITDIRSSYLKSLASAAEKEVNLTETEDGVAAAISQFGESLESGNVATIRSSLEMVESRLAATEESLQHRTYYCYQLMTVYFSKAKDMRNFRSEASHLIDFADEKQLFEMLHQSVERFCVQSAKAEQVTAGRLRNELTEYIEENFNNKNLSLAMVADHLNTSVYVVTRLFKESTGKNFKEYVLDKRMEHARELLKSTPTKIAEISSMAGFESPEYFSSVFKAKYGITPTQYRKSDS